MLIFSKAWTNFEQKVKIKIDMNPRKDYFYIDIIWFHETTCIIS